MADRAGGRSDDPAAPEETAASARTARARSATAALFLVTGLLFGDWVPRIPEIKERIHADSGPMGVALLGLAAGALLTKPWAGRLVARKGSAPVTRIGITLSCAALVLPALAVNVPTLGLGLLGFGAAMGINDVAINAHGVAVQDRMGRSVMSSFHGVYSVGGLLGAAIGGLAAAGHISPLIHLAVVAAVLGPLALAASARLLPAGPDSPTALGATEQAGPDDPAGRRLTRSQLPVLWLLGAIGLCGMVGEGAVGDWGAVYLHDALKTSSGFAASGYMAYSIAMATGRLLGDRFIARWGAVQVAAWSAGCAGVGLAAGLSLGRPIAAVSGFAVLGLGLSVLNPVVFSQAGRVGGRAAGPALSVVSSISGCGFLAGPPVIGFVAQAVGLPAALGVVSALALSNAGLIVVAGRLLDVQRQPGETSQRAAGSGQSSHPPNPSTSPEPALPRSLTASREGEL